MKFFLGGTLVAEKVDDFGKFFGIDDAVLVSVEEIEDGAEIGNSCGDDVGGAKRGHIEGMGLIVWGWHCAFRV